MPADRRSVADGLLIVDKPGGWSSHDVVGRCRRLCGTRKIGHAGTLDPMATGVLVVGVNRATRLLTFLVGCDKSYTATIRLGQASSTDDAEGELGPAVATDSLTLEVIRSAVVELTGPIQQVPSAVSAIKVGGQRSYARVRAGEQVELAARPVSVHRFEVLSARPAGPEHPGLDVDVEVDVSSGTYVRALARDLGANLGVGGHLTALRRTRVGGYTVEQAVTLEELDPAHGPGPVAHLLTMAEAAAAVMPTRVVSDEQSVALVHGRRIDAEPGQSGRPLVAALTSAGRLVAVLDESGPQARSRVVFPDD